MSNNQPSRSRDSRSTERNNSNRQDIDLLRQDTDRNSSVTNKTPNLPKVKKDDSSQNLTLHDLDTASQLNNLQT